MSDDYFILQPDGARSGPYAEEELLDLMDAGKIGPNTPCRHAVSGRVSEAGELFTVVKPAETPTGPVAWQPAPFPEEIPPGKPAAATDKSRPRLLYRGNRCVLTCWRSVLLAAGLAAGGWLAGSEVPAMLAAGPVLGSLVLIHAILRRLSTQYYITTVRVEVTEGLLARSSRELRIADIRAINVTRRGLTGLLGIGTITFSSAAGAQDDVVFQSVWRASALKGLVRQLQDDHS